MQKIKHFLGEFLNRIRLALLILIFGDLLNGSLAHFRKMEVELEFIETHYEDLTKDELLSLIFPSRSNMGVIHHFRHIQTSIQNWRIVNAEIREAEILEYRRRLRRLVGK